MQIITQQQFNEWLEKFETEIQVQNKDIFLGRAFNLQFLNEINKDLYNMQSDEEAIRYILTYYLDVQTVCKAQYI